MSASGLPNILKNKCLLVKIRHLRHCNGVVSPVIDGKIEQLLSVVQHTLLVVIVENYGAGCQSSSRFRS